MFRIVRYLCSIGLVLLSISCNVSESNINGLRKYWSENAQEFSQSIDKDGIRFKIDYLPIEIEALKSMNPNFEEVEFSKAIKDYENHQYFKLQITSYGTQSLEEILAQGNDTDSSEYYLNKIRFQLNDDFWIIKNGQMSTCKLYHLEPSINKNEFRFLMVFEDDENHFKNPERYSDLQFGFNDDFFSKEKISFTFSKEQLTKIPNLKM